MGLNKSTGDMYAWATHTWNPLAGECSHDCIYCYVHDLKRFPTLATKYSGVPRLVEYELKTNLGKGNFLFVGSATDMFAACVPEELISQILAHCERFDNTYLFQSKNPLRFLDFDFPMNTYLGTTLESNRDYGFSNAPIPFDRALDFQAHLPRMVSIEPIMDFVPDDFIAMIAVIAPEFVSIGADSKNHNLPEPSKEKVEALIDALGQFTTVKAKTNLSRLLVSQ